MAAVNVWRTSLSVPIVFGRVVVCNADVDNALPMDENYCSNFGAGEVNCFKP